MFVKTLCEQSKILSDVGSIPRDPRVLIEQSKLTVPWGMRGRAESCSSLRSRRIFVSVGTTIFFETNFGGGSSTERANGK